MNQTTSRAVMPHGEKCFDCPVREISLFNNLIQQDFDLIHLPIEEIHLAHRQQLYREGDQAAHIFTLHSGLIKLTHYLADGNQRVVRLVRPGGTIGLEALVSGHYSHYAQTLQESYLCKVPLAIIEKLDQESPRLHKQILTRWHQAVTESDNWLTHMSTGTARERIARLCLYLHNKKDNSCILPGREDIGAMLGITTETASRIIAEFRRKDILTPCAPKTFTIDIEALEEYSNLIA